MTARPSKHPSAIVTGGSAGLGLVIAATLVRRGYEVTVFGRDETRLKQAVASLQREALPPHRSGASIGLACGDATSPEDASELVKSHVERCGGLNVLVNVVGQSDRGRADRLSVDRMRELIEINVVSTLVCSQAAMPSLMESRGVIVNIGSLASRVAPPYMGGYSIAKHALAALTRQMRLEMLGSGVHVGLVCPGPIRRDDAGSRYVVDPDSGIPESASQPGGGAKLKGLAPSRVADAVLRCIERRQVETILPWKVRAVMMLNAVSPRLADRWLG